MFPPVTNPTQTNPDYDAGNQRHVERRTKASKLRERQLAEALKWLMADPRGRLLMWERLADSGVYRSSFSPNPELTAFREGRRDMGLRDLGQIMKLCPEQYTRMAAEAQSREPARDSARAPQTTDPQSPDQDGESDDGRDETDA